MRENELGKFYFFERKGTNTVKECGYKANDIAWYVWIWEHKLRKIESMLCYLVLKHRRSSK